MFKAARYTLPLLLCTATACSPGEEQSAEDLQLGESGLNLRTDVLADTDVSGMEYTITPVSCETGEPIDPEGIISVQRDLEDIMLPGGHPGFEGQPFDADSEHLFADAFQALPAGCYDVSVQPLDADGAPSDNCAPAVEPAVEVLDGQVTEVLLVSQCQSDATLGALDAIAAINHAPELVNAYYEPSKFTCQRQTTICVVAQDPDNDPLTLGIPRVPEGVILSLQEPMQSDEGQWTLCVDVEVPGPGQYPISLTVFDQMYNADGRLVTVESILGEGGSSSDSITLPVHSMEEEACICDCPEGFALNAAGDACERYEEAPAVFNGQVLNVCEGDDLDEYGALGGQFPDGLIVTNSFFGDGFDNPDGRLNAVGIWSCEPVGREWIGFSACVVVEEAGEYVLGAAGDDESRLFVDGQPVFSQSGQAAFRTWWMTPVQLTPGVHVIEMQGRDSGVAATLGAEIYGPFPAGSTIDDQTMAGLDYANNIFWSTGDQLGGVFHSGATTGYSCPEGTSLNLCADEPVCTGYQQIACE